MGIWRVSSGQQTYRSNGRIPAVLWRGNQLINSAQTEQTMRGVWECSGWRRFIAKWEYGESQAANKHIEVMEEYQLFCARGNQLINSAQTETNNERGVLGVQRARAQTETNNERGVLGVQCGSGDDLLPNGNMASLMRPTNISKERKNTSCFVRSGEEIS
ncbi:hypothetical protein J6590_075166 [Homalodisca vitripennis]|nr:hypothetical protein J6590_075166 [Homalodisca vitripennis]